MLALRHRRARSVPVDADPDLSAPRDQIVRSTPCPDAVELALLGDLATLGPLIEFAAAGRYTCGSEVSTTTEVVLLGPCSTEALREVCSRHADCACVVLDRRDAVDAHTVVDWLGAGADLCVSSASIDVLIAHLDALLRRRKVTSAVA